MKHAASGFRYFDHTADIGLEAWGDSFETVFEKAAQGLFGLMVDPVSVQPDEMVSVELSGESGEELLFAWLNELLYIFETKHLALCRFQIDFLTSERLEAKAFGEKLNPAKHKLGREVKAVTRHLFEFKKTKTSFSAKVILDI